MSNKKMGSLEHWLTDAGATLEKGSRLEHLSAVSKAIVVATLRQRSELPLIFVVANAAEARSFIDNVRFFGEREKRDRVHYLPEIDVDYYRGLLPNPEILCERNVSLFHALNDPQGRIFVTSVAAVLSKVVPRAEFARAARTLRPNDTVVREELLVSLAEAGYQQQPVAYDPGVYAVRGGIIDIFCPLYDRPVRLEFFDDLIEEIRFFDPQNQLSLEKLEALVIVPVGLSLIPHGKDFEVAALAVKNRLDHLGVPKPERELLLEKIGEGVLPSELSFLFPLLSKGSEPVLDYFPADSFFLWDGKEKLLDQVTTLDLPRLWKNLELFEKDLHPIADKQDLFIDRAEFIRAMENHATYFFEDFTVPNTPAWSFQLDPVQLGREREAAKQKSGGHLLLEGFAKKFREWISDGYVINIVCHTQVHAERVQSLFATYGLPSEFHREGQNPLKEIKNLSYTKMHLWQGYITQSEKFSELRWVWLSEDEIFGAKKRQTRASGPLSASKIAKLLSNFRDLKVGDFVVHKEHGIGKYLALKSMNFLGVPNDYVLIEYRDNDKLYLPVYRLNVLQKYSGAEGASPVLDKLGGDRWSKAKAKTQQAVAELAVEFLRIQATRKTVPAEACSPIGPDFQEFEMGFPFDETPDQMRAIEEVMADLGRTIPMDRLVCGDVGYGKTEVAIRAAFRCVLDKRQVAVVVPTTVLAFQHFETFKTRMKDTAVRVESVSRLKSAAQNREVMERLQQGKVDVIIGTHRLFSADVFFKDLGLVVIDEEHRFGVAHKERLKKMCESVHVLSMTATPIPRTLNMAMAGIKDISIITTPPPDRQSVRTFVCRQSPDVIREAIANELARDGQIFFVHNRIESIFEVGRQLKELFPKLKFEIVHGQMDGEELEKKMLGFYAGDFQVLLTTAIIESGLDIPRANTILIDDADHFGIAQLYQLRGRVGRSAKRGYCYLLCPAEGQLTEEAKQRLQVIQRYTDLGAGFSVASHDLEIRGAGDLLGKDQSGHISAVGVDMYFELLDEAIAGLQGKSTGPEIEPDIAIKVPAFFPEDYLPDISERMNIYRRLSSVENEESVAEIEEEIRDRFGTLPNEVTNLLGLMRIKIYLKRLHVVKLSSGPKRTSLQFAPSTPARPEKLISLIQKDPKRYSITPDQKLVFPAPDNDWPLLLREVQHLSDVLT